MAKVNLNNIKKSKGSQKNKNKTKNKIDINKENEIKKKHKEASLINQAKQAIEELEKDVQKSYRFNKSKREHIISKIEEINKFIENKDFDKLEAWINSYKELKEEEKKQLEEEQEFKNNKNTEPLSLRIKNFFLRSRIPIYSRIKKIIKEDQGKTKTLKLLAVFGAILFSIALFIVGILIIVGIIPFSIGNNNGVDQIFPAILVALSIGLLYFI